MSYKFRSKLVYADNHYAADTIERVCNEWAEEGFIVFSVVCPDPANYNTYRLTAKRSSETTTQEKFDV